MYEENSVDILYPEEKVQTDLEAQFHAKTGVYAYLQNVTEPGVPPAANSSRFTLASGANAGTWQQSALGETWFQVAGPAVGSSRPSDYFANGAVAAAYLPAPAVPPAAPVATVTTPTPPATMIPFTDAFSSSYDPYADPTYNTPATDASDTITPAPDASPVLAGINSFLTGLSGVIQNAGNVVQTTQTSFSTPAPVTTPTATSTTTPTVNYTVIIAGMALLGVLLFIRSRK